MASDTPRRKEILVVNGTTMVLVLALVANCVIVGLVYRWHQFEVFKAEKYAQVAYGKVLSDARKVKDEIVALEGVEKWEKTSFQAIRPLEWRERMEPGQ